MISRRLQWRMSGYESHWLALSSSFAIGECVGEDVLRDVSQLSTLTFQCSMNYCSFHLWPRHWCFWSAIWSSHVRGVQLQAVWIEQLWLHFHKHSSRGLGNLVTGSVLSHDETSQITSRVTHLSLCLELWRALACQGGWRYNFVLGYFVGGWTGCWASTTILLCSTSTPSNKLFGERPGLSRKNVS